MVVEGDGGVFPCDFYVVDKYKTGNITKDDISTYNIFIFNLLA